MGEREGEKKGVDRKASNVKMTGTPRVFKTELRDFITHTWTTEGMEKPLPVCAHVHMHTHA